MSIGGLPYLGQNSPDWHKPSRLAPASQFGKAGPNPFLTPKDSPLTSLSDVRKRIDAYDKSIGDHFVETTAPWVARSVLTEVGDHYFHWENNPFYKAMPENITSYVKTKISYNDIFGIENARKFKPSDMSWQEFFAEKENISDIKKKFKFNFEGFKFKPIRFKDYLEHVVKQYNVGSVVQELEAGRVLPALGRCIGIGSLLTSVISNTKKTYIASKMAGDSPLKTGLKTAGALIGETMKSVAAWELGSIGFMLGSSLVCVGIIPGIVAGCLVGGIFEALFKSLFKSSDQLVHDSCHLADPKKSTSQPCYKSVLHQGMEVLA